jgi:hypothetical protein
MIQDTVKERRYFGTIIEKQNIGSRKVYEITKNKRLFDVRVIKPNRAYTFIALERQNK